MILKRFAAASTAIALALAPTLAAAQTKISNLPAASTIAATDVVPISQSCSGSPPTAACAATNAATAAQLKTWAQTGISTVAGAVKSNGSGTYGQAGAADLSNGVTGSGSVVLSSSPTLVTPQLGVAKATTLAGKNAVSSFTAGATAQIGAGATVVCASGYVCDSLSGTITLTTGTGSLSAGTTAAPDFTVNFADTRSAKPSCIVSPFIISGGASSLNSILHTETTSTLVAASAGALTASSAYTTSYVCGGN